MAANMVNTLLEKLHLTSPDRRAPAQEPGEEELKSQREKYEKANQEHVFAFYDELDTDGKASLFEQLSTFDPRRINILADKALHPPKASDQEPTIEPLPESATASLIDASEEQKDDWYKAGLSYIAKNKVAVVLMAGGQGTRLGSSDPKGCFDIGLPSKKSLFRMQAERIWKIQQLAKHHASSSTTEPIVPWYVMTSGPTRAPTEKFFQDNNYFGLDKENVIIFEQGVLPCISNEGKILMESKSKVAVAPDGNGGIYQALLLSSARSDMRKRGIEHVHAYCVDNCLVKVADPVFIGFSASKDVDIATKVVRKRAANEPVGLIVLKNSKPDVVEYSEIDTAMAEAKDSSDRLKFRAANIVNHYYSFRFLESIEEWAHQLPHHVAKKKIPYMDTKTGETVKPETPNGIKLEQFVFDVFPFVPLEKFACLEVERKEEFSPLKNARGSKEDNPDTSKQDIMEQGARWLHEAGATVVSEGSGGGVEVSPLISYVSFSILHALPAFPSIHDPRTLRSLYQHHLSSRAAKVSNTSRAEKSRPRL